MRGAWIAIFLWCITLVGQAQTPNPQTRTGRIASIADEVRVPLAGLRVGDTVYAIARGTEDLDAYLILYDSTLSRAYAQDDDSAGGLDAALTFTIEQAGDYVLSFFSISGGGDYVLEVGINTPEVLDSLPELAPTNTPNSLSSRVVSRGTSAQTFRGMLSVQGSVQITLLGVRTGDTIYAYVAGSLDPFITLTPPQSDEVLAEDDDSGGGLASALEYVAERDGDLVLTIYTFTDGDYIANVGINTPSVLTDVGLGDFNTNPADLTYYLKRDELREVAGLLPTPSSYAMIIMESLQEGDIIYAYGRGTGDVDAYLIVMDSDFERTLAEDDDSGGGLDAALVYTVPRNGSYVILLQSIGGAGGFRLAVGVNQPEALSGLLDVSDLENSPISTFNCSTAPTIERPRLSGTMQKREGDSFVIHYTLQGRDATTKEYIDKMHEALVYALRVQTQELGWALPPADCGEGGDTRLDIYVMSIEDEGILGYAIKDNIVGDNPNTPVREFYAAYSHLIIDNTMQSLLVNAQVIALMQSTVAHEVHHNIQFGYDVNDSFYGFYEAGAVWIETLLYPTQTDALDYTEYVLEYPDVCIGTRDKDLSLRIYGEWLMVDSFARDLGRRSYQALWEHLAVYDGLTGFYTVLESLGTTVETVLKRMAVRNLLRDYALGGMMPPVRLEANISQAGQTRPLDNGVQQLSVDYVRVLSKGVQTFTVNGSNDLELLFVGINKPNAIVHELGRRGTVDTRQYEEGYLIVVNNARHRILSECMFTDWTITTLIGGNEPITPPTSEQWNASKYQKIR